MLEQKNVSHIFYNINVLSLMNPTTPNIFVFVTLLEKSPNNKLTKNTTDYKKIFILQKYSSYNRPVRNLLTTLQILVSIITFWLKWNPFSLESTVDAHMQIPQWNSDYIFKCIMGTHKFNACLLWEMRSNFLFRNFEKYADVRY